MGGHITTLDFTVVDEAGRLVKADTVFTGIKGFVGFVKTVPRPQNLYGGGDTGRLDIGNPCPVWREASDC
jgi:hypothetical protein